MNEADLLNNIMRELKVEAENWKASDGFINITTSAPVVSELELKIRKEVMDAADEMMDKLHHPEVSMPRMRTLSYTIKDRLNLLWGE